MCRLTTTWLYLNTINGGSIMYGYDGAMSALEWADLFGFHYISKQDQVRLVEQGYFTPDGHRICTSDEKAADAVHILD